MSGDCGCNSCSGICCDVSRGAGPSIASVCAIASRAAAFPNRPTNTSKTTVDLLFKGNAPKRGMGRYVPRCRPYTATLTGRSWRGPEIFVVFVFKSAKRPIRADICSAAAETCLWEWRLLEPVIHASAKIIRGAMFGSVSNGSTRSPLPGTVRPYATTVSSVKISAERTTQYTAHLNTWRLCCLLDASLPQGVMDRDGIRISKQAHSRLFQRCMDARRGVCLGGTGWLRTLRVRSSHREAKASASRQADQSGRDSRTYHRHACIGRPRRHAFRCGWIATISS